MVARPPFWAGQGQAIEGGTLIILVLAVGLLSAFIWSRRTELVREAANAVTGSVPVASKLAAGNNAALSSPSPIRSVCLPQHDQLERL
jgi:hypothetical protein